MTLMSRSCQAVSRWTPATGDHRNHIPKDYDEAAELHQVGAPGIVHWPVQT
jgi:hypothetical protein